MFSIINIPTIPGNRMMSGKATAPTIKVLTPAVPAISASYVVNTKSGSGKIKVKGTGKNPFKIEREIKVGTEGKKKSILIIEKLFILTSVCLPTWVFGSKYLGIFITYVPGSITNVF